MKSKNPRILYLSFLLLCLLVCGIFLARTVVQFKNQSAKLLAERKPYTFEFNTLYSLCGHTDTHTYPNKQAVTDLTEVKNHFPDWRVSQGTDKITLNRTVKSYCNLHYFAVLSEDTIRITYRDGTLKEEIDARSLSLSEEETAWLKNGVYLDGKEALNAFIEDFNS